MQELKLFKSKQFGKVRTTMIDGKPYFVGADVATALGYSNTRDAINRHCRYVKKHDIPHPQNEEKRITVNVIPEGDLFRLITHSELPSAERFESWVFDEVIPSIRANGSYSLPQSTSEQIKLLAQGYTGLEVKIDSLNKDLQEFKQEMPLLAVECDMVTEAKNRKVVPLLGGKGSRAYKNASLRAKVYRDLEGQIKREFGVSSYKAIHRNQVEKAIDIIKAYKLPLCLAELIEAENEESR